LRILCAKTGLIRASFSTPQAGQQIAENFSLFDAFGFLREDVRQLSGL
jgi:hypothetical protein